MSARGKCIVSIIFLIVDNYSYLTVDTIGTEFATLRLLSAKTISNLLHRFSF